MGASQTSGAVKSATLFIDESCGFCVRSVKWLKRLGVRSLEFKPLEFEPLEGNCAAGNSGTGNSAAQFQSTQNPSTPKTYGHLAIADALSLSSYRYVRWMSAGIKSKWISPIAKQVYKLVARIRHKL